MSVRDELWVPLAVDFYDDERLIEAGPMAELLFVRSLAYAKRRLSDGRITTRQLDSVALRLKSPARLAQTLVDVEAWHKNGNGWVIAAWSKWNRPADEIRELSSQRRDAALLGNHKRWHVPPRGTPSPVCPLCRDEQL